MTFATRIHYIFTNTPPFFQRRDAKEKGFDDNLYLELDTYHNPPPRRSSSSSSSRLQGAILQELSAANVFLVLRTGEIVTPSLKRGTILPGEWEKSAARAKRRYFVLRYPNVPIIPASEFMFVLLHIMPFSHQVSRATRY